MNPPLQHCLLVVDDEPDVCDSIHDLLRREFRVLKAQTAADGFRLMQNNEVHIIMTDQRMPQTTGVDFLCRARAGHHQAVRMLFTGYADLEAIIAAINHGHIFQFLKKPWQPEELLAAVRAAAAEYDRLVEQTDQAQLQAAEIHNLRERLATLETEVQQQRPTAHDSTALKPSS